MNMQIAHLPMTQFWSTDSALCKRPSPHSYMHSALHKWPSPHSYMLMSKVKAEAVPCLQVGFHTINIPHIHTVFRHFTSLLHRDNNTSTTARYPAPAQLIIVKAMLLDYRNKVKDTTKTELSSLKLLHGGSSGM